MTTKTETKKVSDMTEKQLEQKIINTVSKALFMLASEIGKIEVEISDLTKNR
jgi:hypothetical protein